MSKRKELQFNDKRLPRWTVLAPSNAPNQKRADASSDGRELALPPSVFGCSVGSQLVVNIPLNHIWILLMHHFQDLSDIRMRILDMND